MYNPNCSILAGVPPETLQAWLTAAQQAYSELMTGKQIVTLAYDGKSVSYHAADLSYLAAWITQLQQQLGIGCGCGRRALRPYYR